MIADQLKSLLADIERLHTLCVAFDNAYYGQLPLPQIRHIYALLRELSNLSDKNAYNDLKSRLDDLHDRLHETAADPSLNFHGIMACMANFQTQTPQIQKINVELKNLGPLIPNVGPPHAARKIYEWAAVLYSGPTGYSAHVFQSRDETVGRYSQTEFEQCVATTPEFLDQFSRAITNQSLVPVPDQILAIASQLKLRFIALLKSPNT